MKRLNHKKTLSVNGIFDRGYIDSRMLYMHVFGNIPNSIFVNSIDGEKTVLELKASFSTTIKAIHEHEYFNTTKKKFQFDKAVIVLRTACIIEVDEGYCKILHDGQHESVVNEVKIILKKYKEKTKRQPLEINLIVRDSSGLDLRDMEIKRTKLNLSLFYEDDFIQTDEIIRKRLSKKKDKGIVLLHGLPGTGKTTYLRYLVSKIKKRVLFLSPAVAGNLMNPEFIELLVNNPDTVLVIEDAENIIMDRKYNSSSSVSNLLNISDGLLADFLNVQIVCTFNNSLTMIDDALTREGRLIARYEFGKLSIEKAQKLCNHLGKNIQVTEPMTIAEICCPGTLPQQKRQKDVVGFRLENLLN
ncbi:MAG: AAA family ATPase [Niabella sp.]